MNKEQLLDLAIEMRNAQRRYFRSRSQSDLIAAKAAEKAFDEGFETWGKGQLSLLDLQ